MVTQRKHNWYLFPKDSQTNEAIARMLQDGSEMVEESQINDALCEDGQKRNLWRATEAKIWFLWRSRSDLKFEVFNQLGFDGKIRNVTFLFRRDRRSVKKGQKNVRK